VAHVAVETSADRDLDSVDYPTIGLAGLVSAQAPAQSITTYVIRRAHPR
jgi:hypothetical protein